MSKLRVKEILKEKGITGRDLSSKLGMTEVGFYKMLSEAGNPPLRRLEEIANLLECEISDLFERSDENGVNCPNCGARLVLKREE